MAYNDYDKKKSSFFLRAKIKINKLLVRFAPANRIRTFGLRSCGFQVGKKVYIGEDLIITSPLSESDCMLEIQDRVAIAPRVTIILGSDANYSQIAAYITPIRGWVKLEEDCWIGTGSIIHPFVTIGKCAIIGSGSVVTKSVPPFTIVAGVPAREIGKIVVGPDKEMSEINFH